MMLDGLINRCLAVRDVGDGYIKLSPAECGDLAEVLQELKWRRKEWPNHGDVYYTVLGTGEVEGWAYQGMEADRKRQEVGNFFRSSADAKQVAAELVDLLRRHKEGER